jgi:hypothetical protein
MIGYMKKNIINTSEKTKSRNGETAAIHVRVWRLSRRNEEEVKEEETWLINQRWAWWCYYTVCEVVSAIEIYMGRK